MQRVDVAFMLELVPQELVGLRTVVIDVLRATSTIVAALSAGAPYVVPVETAAAARELAEQFADVGGCYLGGERHRVRLSGFDFGNSPLEYLELPAAKPIVFTTTNGTRALKRALGSEEILIASLGNGAAVAEALLAADGEVLLVCSGTRGQIAAEDVLGAGLIVEEMQNRAAIEMTDAARIALASWQQAKDALTDFLLQTSSGQGLSRLGFQQDVIHAAAVNHSDVVPCFSAGRIQCDR
ncbi:MAG: 2-phosphosulfolactate phosphatase [Firmicutes bacterium]|nr:2-phosphosulfolactate phosphatase [Bacillota bacterium]